MLLGHRMPVSKALGGGARCSGLLDSLLSSRSRCSCLFAKFRSVDLYVTCGSTSSVNQLALRPSLAARQFSTLLGEGEAPRWTRRRMPGLRAQGSRLSSNAGCWCLGHEWHHAVVENSTHPANPHLCRSSFAAGTELRLVIHTAVILLLAILSQ